MEQELTSEEIEKIAHHWFKSSASDHQTMEQLFTSGSYAWALFLGHISLEKMLKAIFVKRQLKHAPFTHNLYRLAELSGLEPSSEINEQLIYITAFNLNTRYDDYKTDFYARCTKPFAALWIKNINNIRLWLIQQF